ncbi:MAG TPA: AbrB/MazE/SpoVT family DNA-binding domain-containing protein [Blastocatellia bacterium]|jgi:antitoxin MazE|nr:AbrB/MazE/SpoVT family DNA-binding domain-containing protein [Blastocatellia bacterium]
MKVQVQRWGNSLALRIPKNCAIESSIEQGTLVDVSVVKGKLVVAPVADRKYTLEELLDGVTKRNIHAEIDSGPSVGKESW